MTWGFSLRDAFPNLYAIAYSKEAWMIDVWKGGQLES